jgi:hypothetical protein
MAEAMMKARGADPSLQEPTIEPLSSEHCAAVLIDAVNDILEDDMVSRLAAVKLAGAYHQFAIQHLGINEDAIAGQKSATDLAKGPRSKGNAGGSMRRDPKGGA